MTGETSASLKEIFTFPFRDPDWKNSFVVGSAIIIASCVIPILPLILVYGYVLQVMRRAIEGEKLTLPPWDNWGRLATDGLRTMVVSFFYLLPGVLVMLGGTAVYFIGLMGAPMAGQTGDEAWVFSFLGSMAVMFLSMFVGTLLMLLGTIPLPLAAAHFAAEDDLSAAFRVGEWWALLKANPMGYFVAWVIAAGLMAVFYVVTMLAYYTVVLCCAIPILGGPIGFYLLLVSAVVFGRFYRESVRSRPATPIRGTTDEPDE